MPNKFPFDALAEFDPEVRGRALPEQEAPEPRSGSEMPPPVSTAPGAVKMGGVDGWPEGDVLEFAAESPEERGETEEVTTQQHRLSIPSFHDRKIVRQTLADYDVPVDSYDWEGQEFFVTDDETVYELVKDALPDGGYREVNDEQMGANTLTGYESPRSVRPATVNQIHRNYEDAVRENEKISLYWGVGEFAAEKPIGTFVVTHRDADRLRWAFKGEITVAIEGTTNEPAVSYDNVITAIKNTYLGGAFYEAEGGWGKYHDKPDEEIEAEFANLASSTSMHDYKFPATADEWGLYGQKAGAEEVAARLTARVKATVTNIWNEIKYAVQMRQKMSGAKLRKIMEREFQTLEDRYLSQGKFKEFGADDTVVREKVWEVINDLTPAFLRKEDDDKDDKKDKDKEPKKGDKGLLLGKAEAASPEEELAFGVKVEMEHADTIKRIQSGELKDIKDIATAIAQDHIKEFPDYYTRLKAMEADAKAAKGGEEKAEDAESSRGTSFWMTLKSWLRRISKEGSQLLAQIPDKDRDVRSYFARGVAELENALELMGEIEDAADSRNESEGSRVPKVGEIYDTPSYGKVVITAVQDGKVFADMLGVTGDKSVLHEYPLTLWREMNPKFVGQEEPGDVNRQAEARQRKFDLHFGHLGNGTAVWNSAREVHGDYEMVAHIEPDGEVTFYVELPDEEKQKVLDVAKNPTWYRREAQPETKPKFDIGKRVTYDFYTRKTAQGEKSFRGGSGIISGRRYDSGEWFYIIDRDGSESSYTVPESAIHLKQESQPDRPRDAGSSPQGGHDPETVVKTEFTADDDPDKMVKTDYTDKDDKAKKGEKKESAEFGGDCEVCHRPFRGKSAVEGHDICSECAVSWQAEDRSFNSSASVGDIYHGMMGGYFCITAVDQANDTVTAVDCDKDGNPLPDKRSDMDKELDPDAGKLSISRDLPLYDFYKSKGGKKQEAEAHPDYYKYPNGGWWASQEEKARGMSDEELAGAIDDAQAAITAKVPNSEGKYYDELSIYRKEQKRRQVEDSTKKPDCPFDCDDGVIDIDTGNPEETVAVKCPHCNPPRKDGGPHRSILDLKPKSKQQEAVGLARTVKDLREMLGE